ncbi:hypothetical protein TcWFU_001819 [Taenia crassiceps]|uniref:Uncharacterized protein n=1 Tax=Taenia crassiceps TaxID=6207 RepID=A0ABR4QG74_9CEST
MSLSDADHEINSTIIMWTLKSIDGGGGGGGSGPPSQQSAMMEGGLCGVKYDFWLVLDSVFQQVVSSVINCGGEEAEIEDVWTGREWLFMDLQVTMPQLFTY